MKKRFYLIGSMVLCLIMANANATVLFQENYPDENALSVPSSGSIKVAGMNVSLVLSGTTDSLVWESGIADGIAGPASGGVLKSGYRTSGGAYAYLVYSLEAPSGQLLSDTSASITVHTYPAAGYKVILESSTDGGTWENLQDAYTNGFGETAVITTDQTGDTDYQNISTVYYRISMPTFLGPTTSWHSVVDDIEVNGSIVPEPTTVLLFLGFMPLMKIKIKSRK